MIEFITGTTSPATLLIVILAHNAAITKAPADKPRIGSVDEMQGQGSPAVIYSIFANFGKI